MDTLPTIEGLTKAATRAPQPATDEGVDDGECASCGEGISGGECAKSQRPCGHHCNHTWTHDTCDWCGTEFGEPAMAEAVTSAGTPVDLLAALQKSIDDAKKRPATDEGAYQ